MLDEVRIRELVEEALDSDRTPEEVCREAPELLADVRNRWTQLQGVQAQIDRLFPQKGSVEAAQGDKHGPDAALPQIPGYEVKSVLGRGGVGVVYKARHLALKRDVAVKMLLSGEYAGPKELARFRLEAEAVASLRHPNIVQVHDVGELDGRPFFTMEFVEGGSLAQKLAGIPQQGRAACELLTKLAAAVQVAHEGGIVHRDLKPSNVMLTADGIPKITDFGLARRLTDGASLTVSGVTLGTPSYMAPEQVQGSAHNIGPAVDVYALGAILYEMLTGRPPFRAESALATQMQVLTHDPVRPSHLNSEVARDLETICLKCLHKDPLRRYPSAAALAQDLQRFQRGEPIAARPIGSMERALKWARRRPAQASALAGSSLVILLLFGAGLWSSLQRATIERAVDEDLQEVVRLERVNGWAEARTGLERAKVRLGSGGSVSLRERLLKAERELDLVARLGDIRLGRTGTLDPHTNLQRADREYADAFQRAGIGTLGEDPAHVAGRVAASNVHDVLVSALDDWAVCMSDPESLAWILEVTRRADPDPSWRDRVRDPLHWNDLATLSELSRSAPVSSRCVQLIVALGERLETAGGNGVDLLRRVQCQHPDDFWANFSLGTALGNHGKPESVAFYRAALAARPTAAPVYTNLGAELMAQDRFSEAMAAFQQALRFNPVDAIAHANLAAALVRLGLLDEAIEHCNRAIEIDSKLVVAHGTLGQALFLLGRFAEARVATQSCVDLIPEKDPRRSVALTQLGHIESSIAREARLDTVLRGESQPAVTELFDFAETCRLKGVQAAAARFYAAAFEAFPQLAESQASINRLEAACAAALAGTSRGESSDEPYPKERERLRGQAREWLWASLESWVQALDGGGTVERGLVQERLTRTRIVPDLAGIREPGELSALSKDERKECFDLWKEVDAQLERAKAP